jgi:hypothetical protein
MEADKRRAAKHLWKVKSLHSVLTNVFKAFKYYKFEIQSKELIIISAIKILLMVKKAHKKISTNIDHRKQIRVKNAFKF